MQLCQQARQDVRILQQNDKQQKPSMGGVRPWSTCTGSERSASEQGSSRCGRR